MKKYPILSWILILLVFTPSTVFSQKQKDLSQFLSEKIMLGVQNKISTDSFKKKNWIFKFPKKNEDSLVSYLRRDIKKEIKSAQNICIESGGGEIETAFEIKTYAKGKIISLVEDVYFYSKTMPSPDYYHNTYNYINYKGHIYKVTLEDDNPNLIKIVDSAAHAQFEDECVHGIEIDGPFDLLFDKGLFIVNPLHTKACDENIEIKNAMEYLKFTKMN